MSFAADPAQLGCADAWWGVIFFTFQIYIDFSAYSDMAIGLARMFGFRLNENFNKPYISCSITEFWRRWHISLSTWIRDYLYIPLGGNRVASVAALREPVALLPGQRTVAWRGLDLRRLGRL